MSYGWLPTNGICGENIIFSPKMDDGFRHIGRSLRETFFLGETRQNILQNFAGFNLET
jgi:hypothetical protein